MFIYSLLLSVPELFLLNFILFLVIYGILTSKMYPILTKSSCQEQKPEKLYYKNIILITTLAQIGLFITFLLYIWHFMCNLPLNYIIYNQYFMSNNFIFLVKISLIIFTFLVLQISKFYYKIENLNTFEYVIFILLSTFGLLVFVSSNNLILLYLSLELQSLSLYALCSYKQSKNSAVEAGCKFFIMGAVSSGFLLFGIVLIYGMLGTLNFSLITMLSASIYFDLPLVISFGIIFILIGLLFKLGIAPFHLWLVDLYEGASTLVISYISIIPKIAVISVLTHLINVVFINYHSFFNLNNNITYLLCSLGFLSIILGIIGALFQTKLRSFIAYSSIANMGFILILISNLNNFSLLKLYFSIFMYIIIYSIILLGIFTILVILHHASIKKYIIQISELSGFYKNSPGIAIIFLINFFSLMGLPPLAGFFSKFFFGVMLINSSLYFFILLIFLLSVISAFYYLRLVKLIIFDKLNLSLWIHSPKVIISNFVVLLTSFQFYFFMKPTLIIFIYNFLSIC